MQGAILMSKRAMAHPTYCKGLCEESYLFETVLLAENLGFLISKIRATREITGMLEIFWLLL